MLAFGVQRPVFLRNEGLNLGFSLADHAQRRTLHAPRGQTALHFLPEQRREIEADEVIERAARLLRVDEIERQPARLRDRLAYGILGDFIEGDAMYRLAFELAAIVQQLVQMPGDRFALAIRVGREIESLGLLQRAGNRIDVLLVALDHVVFHREAFVGIDRAFLRHEIPHVTIGGEHLEVLPEVLLDGLGLGRRFDDDEIVGHWFSVKFSTFQKRKTAVGPRCACGAAGARLREVG